MSSSIADLAARRAELDAELAGVMRDLVAAVADRIEAAQEGERVNVRALAREAKVSPQTVYTELAKRQDGRDRLSSNGDVPPPAPHDDDREAAEEPVRRRARAPRIFAGDPSAGGGRYTLIQSQTLAALDRLADGRHGEHLDRGERVESVRDELAKARPRKTSDAYVRRILRELESGYSPAPVQTVPARKGRTNFALVPAELGRWRER